MATTFTGSFSVTIFNAHSDEEVPDTGTGVADGVAQLYGAEAGAAAAAVSGSEVSNPAEVDLSGASASGAAGDLVPPTEFPLPHNVFGGHLQAASNRFFDTSSQSYMMARVMHWCFAQHKSMLTGRTEQVEKWKNLRLDNPLFSGAFHFNPFLTTRAYREKTDEFRRYLYDFLQTQHRQQALAHYNADNWETELNSAKTPATGYAQTQVAMNPNHSGDNDSGMREWMSDAWTDFICGTTLSTLPITAGDVSDFMYIGTDNTSISKLGPSDGLQKTDQTGTVSSISSYRSGTGDTHVKTLVLSQTPPSGSEEAPILFFPASGSTKFIAYRIESFSGSTVTLKNLSNKATNNQTAVPASGWRYAINDPDAGVDDDFDRRAADWDKDGDAEGSHEGAAIWNPKMLAIHDLMNTKVLAATGHETMNIWNGIGQGFTAKENGWRVPHDQTASQDTALFENATRKLGWEVDYDDHTYRINNYDPETHQKGLHYAATYIRDPSNFAKQHARGAFVSFIIWGEGETNHTWALPEKNVIDAHAARYHLACTIPVQNTNFCIQNVTQGESTSSGGLITVFAITEQFLDLETGGVEPEDFGTYREGSGETSDTERLYHDWAWRTVDAGERIFIYRCGNFLVCVNMADKPQRGGSGRSKVAYPYEYRPPGHISPYEPRDEGQDVITPDDWDALYTKGTLNAGEKLRKIDATTYVNQRATDFLQSQAPAIWGVDNPKGSFSYGPKQATPFDDTADVALSDNKLFMHDDDWNDGSNVPTDETLELPVWTAYFLEIY